MPERVLFDEAGAAAQVGRRIKTLVEFSGVPQGTTGRVLRADRSEDGFTLAIEWDLPERGKPLVDWFTRSEFTRFLTEL